MASSEPSGACIFLSTSFGFGPVSKAVTIAREIRQRRADMPIHYAGSGIDYEFAERSNTFDRLIRADTDSAAGLHELLPQLRDYSFVVSVVNFDLLPVWSAGHPSLYVVDSLAWLWPSPPRGVENAAAYFVQAYLVPSERLQQWSGTGRLVVVGPIRPDVDGKRKDAGRRELLVNFSGCANPFAGARTFEAYVDVLADAVLRHARRFDGVTICCNGHLSAYLRDRIGRAYGNVRIGHLSPDDFIDVLANASVVLSSPGITATLEAYALGTPLRFLLPQNYSQALMIEQYRAALGDRSGMALSRFSPDLAIAAGLPERDGVDAVLRNLDTVLRTRREDIAAMVDELIDDAEARGRLEFPMPACAEWSTSGQRLIADHVLGHERR